MGDRGARPGPARSPRPGPGRAARPEPRVPRRPGRARRRRGGVRPDRDRLARRRGRPARRPALLARGEGAVRAPLGRAAPAAVGDRGADPRPGAPHRRHHRHRRRARLLGQSCRVRPARQPRPVRAGGGGVPGDRRTGHADRADGLAGGGGRIRPGPRRGNAQRGRLGEAADRPPGEGARVGRRVPGRGHRHEVPDQPRPLTLDDRPLRDAGRAAGRRARPAAARWPPGRGHPRVRRRGEGA